MKVRVESDVLISASPERIWSLLCDARLPLTAPCCFKIGIPTPQSCTLVGEASGIGAHRQCRTSQGTIDQQITEWSPARRLRFVALSDTIGLEKHMASMSDTFELDSTPDGTRLRRTTTFDTVGMLAVAKAWMFRASVKHIHRYVMRNFKVLAEAA